MKWNKENSGIKKFFFLIIFLLKNIWNWRMDFLLIVFFEDLFTSLWRTGIALSCMCRTYVRVYFGAPMTNHSFLACTAALRTRRFLSSSAVFRPICTSCANCSTMNVGYLDAADRHSIAAMRTFCLVKGINENKWSELVKWHGTSNMRLEKQQIDCV